MRDRFQPEDFWYIEVTLTRADLHAVFSWDRRHLFDHQFTAVIGEMCLDARIATVVAMTGTERTKYRPTGLNTTEMQKIAARKHKLSPDSHTLVPRI